MVDSHPIENLTKSEQRLARLALRSRKRAYAPYSKYLVGCALEDSKGRVHSGCNVENASYSATLCAERVALFKMVSRGSRDCRTLVVAASSELPSFPCGQCLQVIVELAPSALVIAVNRRGSLFRQATVKELYPFAFSRELLET